MQIKSNGLLLEVEDHGPVDGTPLILIRGQGSQLAHWPQELIKGFTAAGYRTILFDNRDVGLSARCPGQDVPADVDGILDRIDTGGDLPCPYTLNDMAADVIGVLDHFEIAQAHMFGISMGGAILQMLTLEYPHRLLSATLVMSACRPFSERTEADPAALGALARSLLVRPVSNAEYLDAQVDEHARWGSPGYPMPEADIRDMASRAYDRGVDADGMNRQVLAIMAATDRRPQLRNVSLPCLVIHGTEDTLIPLSFGQEIADHIPNSVFREVPGMGHIITPALSPHIVSMVDEFIQARCC